MYAKRFEVITDGEGTSILYDHAIGGVARGAIISTTPAEKQELDLLCDLLNRQTSPATSDSTRTVVEGGVITSYPFGDPQFEKWLKEQRGLPIVPESEQQVMDLHLPWEVIECRYWDDAGTEIGSQIVDARGWRIAKFSPARKPYADYIVSLVNSPPATEEPGFFTPETMRNEYHEALQKGMERLLITEEIQERILGFRQSAPKVYMALAVLAHDHGHAALYEGIKISAFVLVIRFRQGEILPEHPYDEDEYLED